MTDLLEEILRDQSDEKKLKYFTRLLPVVIIITIMVVIGMIINNWYHDKKTSHNMQMGDILLKSRQGSGNGSLEEGDKNLTAKALDKLVRDANNKVADLAMFAQVSIYINTKDYETAKRLLEKIINNKDYDTITTAYARLICLSLYLDQPRLSETEIANFQNYLNYFNNEKQVFFGTVSLIKAIWHIKNNKPELAQDILKNILASRSSTYLLKEQAKALLSTLEMK